MSFAEPSFNEAEEREQDDKRSIMGGAIALAILVFAIILLPSVWMATAFQAFLFGAGLCLVIWTVTYFTAFRGGSNWIALIGFIMLLFVGVAGTTIKYLRDSAGASYDYARARHRMIETLYSPPGKENIVSDAGGPTMVVTGRYLNRILKDRNAYSKAADKADMQLLIEFPQLMERAGMSAKCSKYLEIATLSQKVRPAAHAHAKAARIEIEASELNRSARTEMLAEFDAVQKIFLPMQDRLWTLRSQLADQLQTACVILARGRWQNRGTLMFDNRGDFVAYDATAKAVVKLLNEEADIQNRALRHTVDVLNAM
jgi:hypothetical protein